MFTCWLVCGTSILYQEHKHYEKIRGKPKPYPYWIIYPTVENIDERDAVIPWRQIELWSPSLPVGWPWFPLDSCVHTKVSTLEGVIITFWYVLESWQLLRFRMASTLKMKKNSLGSVLWDDLGFLVVGFLFVCLFVCFFVIVQKFEIVTPSNYSIFLLPTTSYSYHLYYNVSSLCQKHSNSSSAL